MCGLSYSSISSLIRIRLHSPLSLSYILPWTMFIENENNSMKNSKFFVVDYRSVRFFSLASAPSFVSLSLIIFDYGERNFRFYYVFSIFAFDYTFHINV